MRKKRLENREQFGIWDGTSERERRKLRKTRNRPHREDEGGTREVCLGRGFGRAFVGPVELLQAREPVTGFDGSVSGAVGVPSL